MTTLVVNGKRESYNGNGKLLKELIVDIFAHEDKMANSVIAVKVNGVDLDFQNFDLLDSTLDGLGEVAFTVKSKCELVDVALTACLEYIDVAEEKIQTICDLFAKNLPIDANNHMTELVDTIDYFVRTVSQVKNTLKVVAKGRYEKTVEIQPIEIHLIALLKSLLSAHQAGDLVMLMDLLEYELKDNLDQWKTIAIPIMINMIST